MDVCGVGKVCVIEAKAEETLLKQLSPASGQRRHFPGHHGDIIDYGRRPGGGLAHDSPGMRTGHFHTEGGWVLLQRAVRQNGAWKRDRARCKQGMRCVYGGGQQHRDLLPLATAGGHLPSPAGDPCDHVGGREGRRDLRGQKSSRPRG